VDTELKGMGDKDWKRLGLEKDKWKKIVEGAQGLNWAVEARRERERCPVNIVQCMIVIIPAIISM
jgi:hypothetical protein